MSPLVFAMPEAHSFAEEIAAASGLDIGQLKVHTFPDGEGYFRLLSVVKGRDILLITRLDRPDPKVLPLLLLAAGLRQHNATSITLLAPYLPYMRQDAVFNPGEVVTSRAFAHLISQSVDRLITVDPHLHRFKTLSELYAIPTHCLSSAQPMADWIKAESSSPYLIGPDAESEQWVSELASLLDAPCQTLRKVRKGDKDVEISLPDISGLKQHTIVLVDDIISSGGTLLKSTALIKELHPDIDIICCVTHDLADQKAVQALKDAGVKAFASTDTVSSSSAHISMSEHLAQEIRQIFSLL